MKSTEAYFLVYRQTSVPATPVSDDVVPEPIRSELLADNERLKVLRQAYDVHKQLISVIVFSPTAPHAALVKYLEAKLHDFITPQAEEEATDIQKIVVNLRGSRPLTHLLDTAVNAFTREGRRGGRSWEWTRSLVSPRGRVRLRRYDVERGDMQQPLDGEDQTKPVDKVAGGIAGLARGLSLVLEVNDDDEKFEEWEEGALRVVVCLWRDDAKTIHLTRDNILKLEFAPSQVDQDPHESQTAPEVVTESHPETVPEASAIGDDGECQLPDLFAAPEKRRPVPDTSPSVGKVRDAVAKAWGCSSETVALVVMTGIECGKVLLDDSKTLLASGVFPADVLVAERVKDNLQSVMLYDTLRNTAELSFNHPDRPEYTEEFKVSISKKAPLSELKASIAAKLELDPKMLHLARGRKTPQLKDEAKSLREAGVAEMGSVFVGHGAPCKPDEYMLRVSLYMSQPGSPPKTKDAFELPAKATASVRSVREALAEPLARWAADPEHTEAGAFRSSFDPASDVLPWRRLRLRDGAPGKQFAVLRDERTLRSALSLLSDGRQVAVQVLEEEEDIGADDFILSIRPWRVHEGRLHSASEHIVSRSRSVGDLRSDLTARFKGILLPSSDAEDLPTGDSQDHLEIVPLPFAGPPLTIKRCITLNWAESKLSSGDPADLETPLSEVKDLRDGTVLVVRSAFSAALGPPAEELPKLMPKAKGKASAVAPKALPSARREQALTITVATEDTTSG